MQTIEKTNIEYLAIVALIKDKEKTELLQNDKNTLLPLLGFKL